MKVSASPTIQIIAAGDTAIIHYQLYIIHYKYEVEV